MFTAQLTDCRIVGFSEIEDSSTKKTTYFAIIQEMWGERKWVRLLDPSFREIFPVMKTGTAFLELSFKSKAVVVEDRKGGDSSRNRAKNEVSISISCLTDFKVAK